MTIGTATVKVNFAFPQGITADEFQEYINDLFVELTQGEDAAVDYEVDSTFVNGDPFGRMWQKNVQQLPNFLPQGQVVSITHGVKR